MRKRYHIIALLVALSMAVLLPALGRAQEGQPNRAGLVIQHGDGRVVTACVSFSEPSITGIDLLERAGVSYLAQSNGGGAAVCKLNGEGCDYPAEDCFCKCKGAECIYWAYQRLRDGQWRYSPLGARSTRVQPGAVDGWAWGAGTLQAGARPPLVSFEEVCKEAAPAPPTEAPPVPPTDTPPPATVSVPPAEAPHPTSAAIAVAPSPTPVAGPAAPRPTRVPPAETITGVPTAAPPVSAPAATATASGEGTAPTRQPPSPPPARTTSPPTAPTATAGSAGGAIPTRPAPTARGAAATPARYLTFGALVLLLILGIAGALLRRRGAWPR